MNLNKKILILCILLIFLVIPTAFAQDSSLVDDSSNLASLDNADESVSLNSGDFAFVTGNLDNGVLSADGSNELNARDSTGDLNQNALNDENAISDEGSADSEISHQKNILGDSSGNIIYVGPKGNDIAGSGSLKNPYQTVSKAESVAVDGDTIYLLNGTYNFNNFWINKNLTLIGESQENVILDGSNTYRICSVNATDVSFINLTFQNGYGSNSDSYNGGAISSKVGGYLGIINCTFLNNRADTHGGALSIMLNYATPGDKLLSPVLYVEGSTFINNTAGMYGGAIHASANSYKDVNNKTMTMTATILSSIFINNTGGREQQHSIAISSWESTYFDMHDSVIFADPEKIISSLGAYKALVYYSQHSSRGEGYANVDGNWWGDNANPADFNRTSNIDVNNWIILQAGVSKSYVVATLDALENVDGEILEYDSSNLPKRSAYYSPSSFFSETQVDMIGGVAKSFFNGETPQDVVVHVDNQNITVTVDAIYEDYWYVGDTGYATLQEAINAANNGDTIKAVADVYTPEVLSSEIIIDKNLTITTISDKQSDYVLLTSDNSRIFNVLSGVNLNLSHIIFENGGSTNGGAIYVNSGASVEIENSIFRKLNKAANGGAIYSEGDLVIRNSKFSDISSAASGGAIYIENSNLTISDSVFNDISANGNGGAVYIASGEDLTVTNSNFTDNSAGLGGAIYSNANSNIFSQSLFVDNHADVNYDIIYVNENISAENCIFVENPVNDVCDVYVNNPINTILNKNYWGSNSKPGIAQTNVEVSNWVVLKLSMDEKLELISVNTVHNLTVDFSQYTDGENNYTLESNMPAFKFDFEVNAGELNPESAIFDESNTATLQYSAPSQLGDEVISISKYGDQSLSFYVRTPVIYYWFIGDVGYESLQEAVDAAENDDTIIGVRFNHVYDYTVNINKNLTIKSNSSLARAVFNGLYLENESILNIGPDATVNLIDLSFVTTSGNENGGAIINNGNLIISNALFNRNNGNLGGAIFNNGSLTVTDSNFTYNNATQGGAIYNNGSLTIVDSSFTSNTAVDGAAIYNYGELNIERSSFSQNKAENNGGAIASIKEADIRNSIFLSNSALNGGAIYSRDVENYDDSLIVKYSIFDGNNASVGKTIAGVSLFLDNNFFGLKDYNNLIYNLSSGESIEPSSDFKYVITGPSEIGFGETAEFEIELQSNTGDVSYLAEYNLTVTTLLSNRIDVDMISINQGKVILTYIANQEIGTDSIRLNDISGIAGEFTFQVTSLETRFDVEDLNMHYNDGSILNIYLRDEHDNALAEKPVTIYFNNEKLEKTTDSQGRVQIEIGDLKVGNYTGNISFAGESNYFPSNASFNVEISRIPTEILADDVEIYYNGGNTLDIALNDYYGEALSQKELSIQISNNDDSSVVYDISNVTADGKVIVPLNYLPGNYTVSISFAGDSEYESNAKSVSLKIDKMPTSISGDDLVVYYNSTCDLEIFLKDNNGNSIPNAELNINIVNLNDGSVIYSDRVILDADGKFVKELSLDIDNYQAQVSFEENNLYYGSTKTINIDAVRMPTNIGVNTIVLRAHEEANLIAYLYGSYGEAISNKNITLSIRGIDNDYAASYELSTDANGRIAKIISLAQGNYNISLSFAGDDYYDSSSREISQNVLPSNRAYFEAEDLVMNISNGSIVAYLKDPNGNPLEGELVSFDINGTILMNVTDASGKAVMNVDNPAGEYTVLISFDGNDECDEGLKTIFLKVIDPNAPVDNETNGSSSNGTNGSSVAKKSTKLIVSNMVTTTVVTSLQGKIGKYLTVTLKDSNNKALANKKIVISYNGKVFNRVTDSKGVVKLQINLKNKGTYTFAVTFLSDSQYLGSFAVAKVKVKAQKVKMKVPKKTFKSTKKVKKLTATLKNAKGKAIKGKKITFIVNKKKYKAKTNKKGKATVKVKLSKKKTYKVTVKFAGDKTYKKLTKKSKVKIK